MMWYEIYMWQYDTLVFAVFYVWYDTIVIVTSVSFTIRSAVPKKTMTDLDIMSLSDIHCEA